GRVWTALTFYFPAETLANADKDDVFRGIAPWLATEGLAPVAGPSYPLAAQPAVASPAGPRVPTVAPPAPPPPPQPIAPAQLAVGMSREDVVAAMGPPQREMSFEGRTWLTYPNMVIVLEGGKLKSIDQSAPAPAKVAIRSTPDGAEIYLDGQ